MNESIIKGKWKEFKGEMRKMWGDLTDDDLDRTQGNVQAIGGIIQQKYGAFKDDTRSSFDRLVDKYADRSAETSQAVKENLREDRREDRH